MDPIARIPRILPVESPKVIELPLILVVAVVVTCVLVFGIHIALRSIRGRVVDDHPRCRRCHYDLIGSLPRPDHCPECGSNLWAPNAVTIGTFRLDGRRLAAGLALIVLALGPLSAVAMLHISRAPIPTANRAQALARRPLLPPPPQFTASTASSNQTPTTPEREVRRANHSVPGSIDFLQPERQARALFPEEESWLAGHEEFISEADTWWAPSDASVDLAIPTGSASEQPAMDTFPSSADSAIWSFPEAAVPMRSAASAPSTTAPKWRFGDVSLRTRYDARPLSTGSRLDARQRPPTMRNRSTGAAYGR